MAGCFFDGGVVGEGDEGGCEWEWEWEWGKEDDGEDVGWWVEGERGGCAVGLDEGLGGGWLVGVVGGCWGGGVWAGCCLWGEVCWI